MTFPRKIVREGKVGLPKRVRSPGHLAWVRKHGCGVPNCDDRPIEAAHVRMGTAGGMGIKPDDRWVISLCMAHHQKQHTLGEVEFERVYGLNMKALAAEFARKSPHRRKFQ